MVFQAQKGSKQPAGSASSAEGTPDDHRGKMGQHVLRFIVIVILAPYSESCGTKE